MSAPDLMETGIYTIAEAAYLVRAPKQRVRGWVTGHPRRSAPPIIDNEIGWLDGKVAFSFTNLMEIRFIAFFERAGVHFRHIRAIMEDVKRELNHPHPFATDLVFRTDGKKIVAEIALKNGGKHIYDLKTKNYEMRMVVLETLKDDVIYNPAGLAQAWYPRRRTAPNVLVHPMFAFGHPVLKDSRIPTRTIADAVQAEGKVRRVADWYDVPEKQVREAVKFELTLREAA